MSAMSSQFSLRPPVHQAADIKKLLLHKAVKPPSKEEIDELRRLSTLNVSSYSEADVRAEILDPVVRILVYRRSEEHTSELQSLMRISYAVFCLTKKKKTST